MIMIATRIGHIGEPAHHGAASRADIRRRLCLFNLNHRSAFWMSCKVSSWIPRLFDCSDFYFKAPGSRKIVTSRRDQKHRI